ncbi:hypothetical protein [Hyphococcus luteus]|uniref:N-terminal of MaoC-like dehydratase domain-containing protein n=1 Tax=Hyphococcus luteus TaxID=2058213 RepID=A0A2S7K867_9PROT|nr:hypothetical protein [Marinicaulis flavus]PQA88659.1 hypothetical protein CW354_10300 [Marinicaulis flavus]
MTDAIKTVRIDKRFCGPKSSGNGGYSAGLFAQAIDGPASVTLKAPPPLETPIELRVGEGGKVEAIAGETLIAVAEPGEVSVDPPAIPDDAAVAAAHDAFVETVTGRHIIPYCFVCGDRRAPGDGLRIFSGPAPDSPVNADFWTPAADLAGEDGLVRPEFLWAALDCPTAYALRVGERMTLLGRMTAEIRRRPKPGERLIAAAWRTGEDGRKHFSSSVLLDEKREIVAAANAIWIELNDPALVEKIKGENA